MSRDAAVNDSFEALIGAVETRLCALEAALAEGAGRSLEPCCAELNAALAAVLGRSPGEAPLSGELRERLVSARGRIAGQRESIARAIGAAARAAEVLLPRHEVYQTKGGLRFARA